MHINCPFCGNPYDIDESLMPEGDVKVRCSKCSNIFVLNRETGLVPGGAGESRTAEAAVSLNPDAQEPAGAEKPAESPVQAAGSVQESQSNATLRQKTVSDTSVNPDAHSQKMQAEDAVPAEKEAGPTATAGKEDFMKTVLSEISSAVAEDAAAKENFGKKSSGQKPSARKPRKPVTPRVSKTYVFQVVIFIILLLALLAAAGYVLVYLGIIDVPFVPRYLLPDMLSKIKSLL